jgi:hypothetical protein
LPSDALHKQSAAVARALWALCRALGRLAWLLLVRLGEAVREARHLGLRESARRTAVASLRAASLALASTLVFTLVTAWLASHVASGWLRALAGVVVVAAMPLLASRFLGWPGAATAGQAVLLLALLVGFGGPLGTALRRHGDWFLPRRESGAPAWLRARIGVSAMLLEGFAPPAEMMTHEEPGAPFYGPWRPDDPVEAPPPVWACWVHPLGQRVLPAFESRRFGASRSSQRPVECELGHCGVDLAAASGVPVVAVADGVVEHVERDAVLGGRAGRYVRVAHLEGRVVTRYIHLDGVRADLRPGLGVVAGARLGTVGRTGVDENFPHLHFALSRRGPNGAELYVDPEPFLRVWDVGAPCR